MAYLTPVDVANRALQHLGATRIDAALGFAESSLNASETAFAYDKLLQCRTLDRRLGFCDQKGHSPADRQQYHAPGADALELGHHLL